MVLEQSSWKIFLDECTSYDCRPTFSLDFFSVNTAPTGVSPPLANVINTRSMSVTWPTPKHPNGVLTGYILYVDDMIVYQGLEQTHSVENLDVSVTCKIEFSLS